MKIEHSVILYIKKIKKRHATQILSLWYSSNLRMAFCACRFCTATTWNVNDHVVPHRLWHNHATTKNQYIFKDVLINVVVVVVALVRKDISMTLCLQAIVVNTEIYMKKISAGKALFSLYKRSQDIYSCILFFVRGIYDCRICTSATESFTQSLKNNIYLCYPQNTTVVVLCVN